MRKKKVLVVGAGISGATIARLLAEKDYDITVYEKDEKVGGACSDCYDNQVYKQHHGSHIFHTDNAVVWDFLNKFTAWQPYHHKVFSGTHNSQVHNEHLSNDSPVPQYYLKNLLDQAVLITVPAPFSKM